MAELNSAQAAALVVEQTRRSCTRQNIESLVRRGRLPQSTISSAPVRLSSATLVDEYLARIDRRQEGSVNPGPGAAKEAPTHHRRILSTGDLPDYNESRARSEFEKANLLELERKTKEGELLRRDEVERSWAEAVTIAKTKLLAVPTRARQRIPHLTLDEIEVLTQLVRESLEEIADAG
jgi:hypothetical protein